MKVNSTIFWTILIVIITETIGAKYLLVAVDITRDVGMYFTLLQELNTSRSHKIVKTTFSYEITTLCFSKICNLHFFSSRKLQGKMRAPRNSALVVTIRGVINSVHGITAVRLTILHLLDIDVTATLRS